MPNEDGHKLTTSLVGGLEILHIYFLEEGMETPREEEKVSIAPEPNSVSLTRGATGPRTSMGKERSKYNSVQHGIFCQVALLRNERRAEFDWLLTGYREYFQPKGIPEQVLVEQLAVLKWRYRRLLKAEAANLKNPGVETDGGILDNPERLFRYEAGIERCFARCLDQLERLQRMRLGQPVLPKLEVQHSLS